MYKQEFANDLAILHTFESAPSAPESNDYTSATMLLPRLDGPDVVNTWQNGPGAVLAADAVWTDRNDVANVIAGMHGETAAKLELERFRQSFNDLDPLQRVELEPYLDTCAQHAFAARHALRPAKAGQSWSEWLGNEASESDLLAFMDAHAAILESTQTAKVAEAMAGKQNLYIRTIEAWAANRRFSQTAAQSIKRLQRIRPRVGDVWDVALKQYAAYMYDDTGILVVGHGTDLHLRTAEDSVLEYIDRSLVHELDHVSNGQHMPAIFREALAQHIASTIDPGAGNPNGAAEFDILRPSQRSGDDTVYYGYRELTGMLAEDMPVELWTRAHSALNAAAADYTELNQRVMARYGLTLEGINDRVLSCEDYIIDHDNPDDPTPMSEIRTKASFHVMSELQQPFGRKAG